MKTILLVVFGALIGFFAAQSGEIFAKDEIETGRYAIVNAGASTGFYRLDVKTGEVRWCTPDGTKETGYFMKCHKRIEFEK